MLKEYLNPRYYDIASTIDISPRYSLDIPKPVDPTEYDKRSYYNGNRKIKRAGVVVEYTPEMLEELDRCKNDILYFAERYCYIRTLDYGRILIPLRDYQKEFLRITELKEIRNTVFLAARQSAKSTTFVIRILHTIIFNSDYHIAILANKGKTAREIFSRVRLAYQELPFWLQVGVEEWNKGSIELDNGSKCFAESTSSDTVRGFSLNECVTGDTEVTIRNNDVIQTTSISNLFFSSESAEILTDRGFKSFTNVEVLEPSNDILKLDLGFTNIRCTADHEIYTNNGKIPAKDLKIGSFVQTSNGLAPIKQISIVKKEPVYDVVGVDAVSRFYANDILVSNCLLDEFAFVKGDEEFYTSTYPVIASGKTSRITMTSTPNGKKGVFYRTVMRAIKGKNNFFSFGVPWYLVPDRDEAWKKQTIEDTSLDEFRQEHNLEFLSSARSLIDNATLERIALEDIIEFEDMTFNDDVEIIDEPEEHAEYVMTVDPAEGKNQDSSAFTIFRTDVQPYEPVATYSSNSIPPVLFAILCGTWAAHYNMAFLVVENNNAAGAIVSNTLFNQCEYENMFITPEGANVETSLGVRTTAKVKTIGCMTLKSLLKTDLLKIRNGKVLDELNTFEASGSSYEAADDCHDDYVSNLWLFAWLTTQPEFSQYLKSDSIEEDMYEEEIEAIVQMTEKHEADEVSGSISDFW